MKILKRKILFTLASEIDFFKMSEGFTYHPYTFFYQRLLDFKSSSIRDATLQLVKSAEVDKIIRNNVPLFRLTARGRERLLSFFPISVGQKKVWDHIWRIVIVNTRKRSSSSEVAPPSGDSSDGGTSDLRKLRHVLHHLGFKKLSRGVYLTPLPISAKLQEILLKEKFSVKIAVIESRRLLLGDDKQLAKQIWRLNTLLNDYFDFVNKAKILLKRLKVQKRLTNQNKEQFSLILDFFFSLLEKDPGLPKKLLPDDWPFDLAKELFLRLAKRMEGESYSSI